MPDPQEDTDVEGAALTSSAESAGDQSFRGTRRWWRPTAVVVLLVVFGGLRVLTESPDPDGARPEREAEVGTDDVDAADAAVVPASTADLWEDIHCWWDGADAEACDVWAVESDLGPFSHVVAAGERVIVAVEDAVVALDGSDGAVLWTWRDEVPALMAATSTRVFVTDVTRTVALDAATGTQVWHAELRETRWLWQSIRDGVVVNREPSSMAMFAAEDGTLLWERNVPAAGGDGTPVIADEVIITVADEELVGYSRADGEQLWEAPLSPTLPSVHWPGDDLVIVAEDDRVSAAAVATGAQVWTIPAKGVQHLAAVDAGTVAVAMPDRVDLVDRATGTIITPVHAPGLRAIRAAPDGGFFTRVGTTGVRRWQTEPLMAAWNLHARMRTDATYVAIESDGGETYVIAPITDGTTLAAFRVTERDNGDLQAAPSCDGAHPSWQLARLTAWAGQEAHVAILTDGPQQQQLWIGLPGQNPAATSFTVSARPLDTTGVGRFSLITDDWQQEVLVNSGGRSAAEFPPHWVVAADLPQPGCWEIRVSGDQVDDAVVLPVPVVDDTNNP